MKQKNGVEEKGEEKDSTINENNLKYKYKHRQIQNQICLSATFKKQLNHNSLKFKYWSKSRDNSN